MMETLDEEDPTESDTRVNGKAESAPQVLLDGIEV
jgi:hypothetical protein